MKLRFKEDPKEWRKSMLLTLLGLALLSSVLRWRHVLQVAIWVEILFGLAIVALAAWIRPRWFRGFYRFSIRVGFWSSQVVVRILLFLIFFFFITPLGVIMKVMGKDPLRLKRFKHLNTFWQESPPASPLDRLF